MGAPSKDHWKEIHAKAWKDAKFRKLFESDPRKALDQFADEKKIKRFDKIVALGDESSDGDAPPACC